MRHVTAERIRDGKGWYWPSNARKAHYYDQDNLTVCGTGFILVLPDELDGFDAAAGPDDCAACRRKVTEAQHTLRDTDHPADRHEEQTAASTTGRSEG